MDNANPINILMNNIIIGTLGSVADISQTLSISTSGVVIVKLEGVQSTTTAVDNIIVV